MENDYSIKERIANTVKVIGLAGLLAATALSQIGCATAKDNEGKQNVDNMYMTGKMGSYYNFAEALDK